MMKSKHIGRLAGDSDRAVGIVAAAIVEARMTSAIESRFHPDEKIQQSLFRSSGPLGAFSTKIDLAFLIGLISKEARRDLVTMEDIRNALRITLTSKTLALSEYVIWPSICASSNLT